MEGPSPVVGAAFTTRGRIGMAAHIDGTVIIYHLGREQERQRFRPEIFMAALRVGLEVSARSVAYPDKIFTGAVSGIDTRVDPVTRSVRVRALLPNEKELLKPGMFLTVRVIRNRQTVLVIPEQCIVPEQDRKYVFVIENDTAEKRQVTTGRRREGEVEILAGLASGEIVVVEGTQKLDEGTPVKARRMESGSEAGP